MARSRTASNAPSARHTTQARTQPADAEPPRPSTPQRSGPQVRATPAAQQQVGTPKGPAATQPPPPGDSKASSNPSRRDPTPPRTPPSVAAPRGDITERHAAPSGQQNEHAAAGALGATHMSTHMSPPEAVTPPPSTHGSRTNGAAPSAPPSNAGLSRTPHSRHLSAAGQFTQPAAQTPQSAASDGVVHVRTPHPAVHPQPREQAPTSRAASGNGVAPGRVHPSQTAQGALNSRTVPAAQQSGWPHAGPPPKAGLTAGSPSSKASLQQASEDGQGGSGVRQGPPGQGSPRRKRSQEPMTDENEEGIKAIRQGPFSPGRSVRKCV